MSGRKRPTRDEEHELCETKHGGSGGYPAFSDRSASFNAQLLQTQRRGSVKRDETSVIQQSRKPPGHDVAAGPEPLWIHRPGPCPRRATNPFRSTLVSQRLSGELARNWPSGAVQMAGQPVHVSTLESRVMPNRAGASLLRWQGTTTTERADVAHRGRKKIPEGRQSQAAAPSTMPSGQ